MSSENTVTLVGNATKDPDLRYTASGSAVAAFGLAVNRRYQQNGEWVEVTSFFNIVAWRDLGEHLAASITKGTRVFVTGRLEQRSYDDKEGNKRSVTEVIADDAGPSLKWAECTIERIARDDSRGSSGNTGPLPEEEPFLMDATEADL